jgi:hypothetical protein
MADYDDTGLWGVGYMMIVIGGGVVFALIATGVLLVRIPKGLRTPHHGPSLTAVQRTYITRHAPFGTSERHGL